MDKKDIAIAGLAGIIVGIIAGAVLFGAARS